jgi:tight adherence protein B
VSPALLMLLTFLAAAAAIAGAGSVASDLFLRDRSRLRSRIDDEFRGRQRDRARRSLLFKELGQASAEVAGDRPGVRERFAAMIEQSGLDLEPRQLLVITVVAGLAAGLLGGLARRSVPVGIVAAAVGAALPPFYVERARKARLEKLRSQLPDAFDLMARVIRAGQTMSQAQMAIAEEFQPPIAGEFSYCFEQQNLGLSTEIALRDLARRTGLLEIKIFVTALLVQQQTGGNLSELLEKLAAVVRDRYRIRGKIKTLTAEGRMQGLVLLFLPPALFLIMLAMNREFAEVLLEYPMILVGVAASETFGALWIRKIVNFDF